MENTPSPVASRAGGGYLRSPLADVTPPPVSPPGAPRGSGGPSASVDPEQFWCDGDAGLSLQRFSIRSRRSAPYPQVPVRPGVDCLKPPPRLARSGELNPGAMVKVCSCSWEGPLKPSQKRLCARDTEEHDEYRLLQAMSRRFALERARDGEGAEPEVARMASSQKLEVHFILEPSQEVVVGYVALQKAQLASNQEQLRLHQIYVEPECRKTGYAATALRLILAKTSSVALPATPLPGIIALMDRVGFTDSRLLLPAGAPELGDGASWINFCRATPRLQQWEDAWSHS